MNNALNDIKNLIFKFKYEITLLVVSIILCTLFFYTHGNISTDVGREAMIPLAITDENILYKDILNTYGPFSYYLNALLFCIFPISIDVLYYAGCICSIIFLFNIFNISSFFCEKKLSLFLTLFVALTCVYNSRLFNFILPYSYAVIYGLTAYCIATNYLLKFLNEKNSKFIYLAGLWSGIAFANKIEFLPISIITLFIFFKNEHIEIKNVINIFAKILIIPLISYAIPFIQGLTIDDAINAIEIFKLSTTVPSVQQFASTIGTTFNIAYVSSWISGSILLLLLIVLGKFLFKHAQKPLYYTITLIVLSAFHYYSRGEIHFAILAIVMAFILYFNYKKFSATINLIIICGLGASLKTFFNLNTNEYGAYTFPLLFVALMAIIYQYKNQIGEKFNIDVQKLCIFILSAAILSNTVFAYMQLKTYYHYFSTARGTVNTLNQWTFELYKLQNFINTNIEKGEYVLFLPEGSMLNFLCDRPTDMRFYSLNMPYVETYGEEQIITKLSKVDIDYIVLLSGFGLYGFNNPDYYFQENKITNYINDNYDIKYREIYPETKVVIYKKKQN